MNWLSDEQIESLENDYLMGNMWGPLGAKDHKKIVGYVSARWNALPWLASKKPKPTKTGLNAGNYWAVMDNSLKHAFAEHARSLADRIGNSSIKPAADEDEYNILSDMPPYTRNVLLSGYVNRGSEPWEASPTGYGSNTIKIT